MEGRRHVVASADGTGPRQDGLPLLGKQLLGSGALAACGRLDPPDPALLELPEKAVQFGTGAFLRGFVGYFIDEANRQGRFGGRVVAVASTESGRASALARQDGLYTLVAQDGAHGDAQDGARVDGQAGVRRHEPDSVRGYRRLIAAYSRALSARSEWDAVLALAREPGLELVFSNTTEAGIAFDAEDSPEPGAPRSFPGKLTRFLYERGRAFDYADERGLIVLPCELIDDNGDRLREIVLRLARRWRLDPVFSDWVERAVPFCNTLVDRIVPGTPNGSELEAAWLGLGYRDHLLTACEPYRLFAIEADGTLGPRLTFADADPGVILTADVRPFRERKVRLLNGAHTLLAPVGLLCGCETVAEALDDADLRAYLRRLLLDELAPGVNGPDVRTFAQDVLERFANPSLRHPLRDIMLEHATKLRVRVVPALLGFAEKEGHPPASVAFGFAAWLSFIRPGRAGREGPAQPPDTLGKRFRAFWASVPGDDPSSLEALVHAVCVDRSAWGTDLTEVPGFVSAVADHLVRAEHVGFRAALAHHVAAASPTG